MDLIYAIENYNITKVKSLLNDSTFDINYKYCYGITALMIASRDNKKDIVKLL